MDDYNNYLETLQQILYYQEHIDEDDNKEILIQYLNDQLAVKDNSIIDKTKSIFAIKQLRILLFSKYGDRREYQVTTDAMEEVVNYYFKYCTLLSKYCKYCLKANDFTQIDLVCILDFYTKLLFYKINEYSDIIQKLNAKNDGEVSYFLPAGFREEEKEIVDVLEKAGDKILKLK